PEIKLARQACRDIAVPLHVDGDILHRDRSRDVLRMPLGEGLDGFVAVIEPQDADGPAVMQVAERGVVVAEYALDLLIDQPRSPVPLRLFVDAPRMPTNASRSQVRRDAFPIDEAERRTPKLLDPLLERLAAACMAGDEGARDAALAMIAAVAGGSRWHVEVPSQRGPLRALVQLPLVRNAVGQPRALSAHWRPEVHTGSKPFDVELASWLEAVLWATPDDSVR